MSTEKQIVNLRQICNSVKKTIADRYKLAYWVRAEIHKLNKYPNGGAYPELVHKEEGRIVAQMRGQIWNNFTSIENKFQAVTKEKLQDGMEVLLFAKIVYTDKGGIALNILDIDPQFTLGALQRERQETWTKLEKQGLLKRNQLLSLSRLPKRIAVISGASSKGLNDFLEVLYKSEAYGFMTHLFSATLQGDYAPQSIMKALEKIAQRKQYFDAVVIVRGGGEEVGMSCYNNYDLCAAIAQFPLPVLTGIGHSTNLTVAEMIAFDNGITPTALAQFFVGKLSEEEKLLRRLSEQIQQEFPRLILNERQDLSVSASDFSKSVKQHLQKKNHQLEMLNQKIQGRALSRLDKGGAALGRIGQAFQVLCRQKTRSSQQDLSSLGLGISRASIQLQRNKQLDLELKIKSIGRMPKQIIQRESERLNHIQSKTKSLDPSNVLKRGFSIARINGKAVSSKNNDKLTTGAIIETEVVDGVIISEITEVKNKS